MARLRAIITFEWEYDADPENYGTSDPVEMAKIDLGGAEGDIFLFLDTCPTAPKIEITEATTN